MSTQFTVHGPYEVPAHQGYAAKTITPDNIKAFWARHAEVGRHRGCYVFAVRAGKGYTPGYVGKATRTFKQEIFTPHKLAKYLQLLADYRKCTPVIFLIVAPKQTGKPNSRHIGELERFLIQVALRANPYLLNIKGTKAEEWSIAGVLRSGKGARSAAARQLVAALKL
jgi:hypothetical protein